MLRAAAACTNTVADFCNIHLEIQIWYHQACQQTQAFSIFSNFLVLDWAPGPVWMCRDRRDIAGRALKARFGRVFVEKVDFSLKSRSPSATYPFFGPLIHEYLFMSASTRFVVCFSLRTRSSILISFSQSPPNHEFLKNG